MKYCYKCKQIKPLVAFHKDMTKKDGVSSKCKICKATYRKVYYQKNKDKELQGMKQYHLDNSEKIRKKAQEYYATEQGLKQHRLDVKEYRKKYPERCKAHSQFTYALKVNKLKRPTTCELCGIKCKPEGHHPDYSKPLDVQWLCHKCHTKLQHCQSPCSIEEQNEIQN